jgi:hypothetical protein
MEKKQFERIMDEWLSYEMNASNELFPREEMYRKLKEKRKGSRKWFFGPLGWTVAATTATAVLLFVIFLPRVSRQTIPLKEPALALKEGEVADEMAAPRARMGVVEMEKAEEVKGGGAFNQLFFQQQNLADKSIVGVDIQSQRDKNVNVTPADNYRLQVQLNQERYVYVFQLGADQSLTRLFPNAVTNVEQNPLQGGPLYNFPSPPNWMAVNENTEGGTIYVIATDKPQQNWDLLYDQYNNLRRETKRQEIVKHFLDELESMSNRQDAGIEVQKFALKKQ